MHHARVQLSKGDFDKYMALHAAMRARGYKRSIKLDDSKWYWLPHAEYIAEFNSDETSMDDAYQLILDALEEAEIGSPREVMLTQIAGPIYCSGLQPVKLMIPAMKYPGRK